MQDTFNIKKTPLYEEHRGLGAKMVNFSGWSMPVFYEKVVAEHKHVREYAGLFDVSHMGEIFVKGPRAKEFLQKMLINDLDLIGVGRSQYTALLNTQGGVIDDLIVYQLEDKLYLLCVNASNIEKDFTWLNHQAKGFDNLEIINVSSEYAQLAIQGPKSFECLESFLCYRSSKSIETLNYGEIACLTYDSSQSFYIARTGYTGEKGYELYVPQALGCFFWQKILMTSGTTKVKAIGLGARDTLRLEACYPLYGQEMDESISPLEAGLAWATRMGKTIKFIGYDALLKQKETGLQRRVYAFQMLDSGIARSHMKVYQEEKVVGFVTSGSILPSLEKRGGLALLNVGSFSKDRPIEIDIREQRRRATIVKKPMYQARIKD